MLFNVLFLGVVASAVCYVTWMLGMKRIGVVRSGVYIYMIPVITMIGAALILKDSISMLQIGGALVTMTGLFLSQWKKKRTPQPEARIEETTQFGG